ncbi:hypothetical protein, partial [Enterococcus casseliflavus]|uniref:hypothetical protein n=1 Tax=Enterococcus casseliflavus TaxID=37734 RepID=UPI003D120859
HSRRLTRIAGWTALAGALIACALGLKMTQHQFQSVSAVLLDIERRSAENVRPEIERRLRLEEERLLRAFEEQLARPDTWAEIVRAEPL